MKMRHMRLRYSLISAAFVACIASPGFTQLAQAPTIQALAVLQPGQWDLRPRGGTGSTKSLCLTDMRMLIQLQHCTASCRRFIVTNEAREATVSYTCPRAGHGQTTIKAETPRLAQVTTQGIDGNEPFAAEYEARRVGACPAGSSVTVRPLPNAVKGKLGFRE